MEKIKEGAATLSKDFVSTIHYFVDFFGHNDVRYWLGGGTFQMLKEEKVQEINESWASGKRGKKHDIDFHIKAEEAQKVLGKVEGFGSDGWKLKDANYRKIVFQRDIHDVELPLLYVSDHDSKIWYYLSHGKKNLPRFENRESMRRRVYHHEVPAEFFLQANYFEVGGKKVQVPDSGYLEFLYSKK